MENYNLIFWKLSYVLQRLFIYLFLFVWEPFLFILQVNEFNSNSKTTLSINNQNVYFYTFLYSYY